MLMEFSVGKRRAEIQGDVLKVTAGSSEQEYVLSKLVMVGARRRFSRPLLILSVAAAVLSLLNADNPFYIAFTVLIFLSAVLLREEGVVLVFDDSTLVLSPLDRRKSKQIVALFQSYIGSPR